MLAGRPTALPPHLPLQPEDTADALVDALLGEQEVRIVEPLMMRMAASIHSFFCFI